MFNDLLHIIFIFIVFSLFLLQVSPASSAPSSTESSSYRVSPVSLFWCFISYACNKMTSLNQFDILMMKKS